MHRETVVYQSGNETMEGYLTYDDSKPGKRPGVMLFPDFFGVRKLNHEIADKHAAMGYVAMCCDYYGQGKNPKSREEAVKILQSMRTDTRLIRERAVAGLARLLECPAVDHARVAATGYCFGGTVAIELARAGAEIAGVVTFHGGLTTSNEHDARQIKAKMLICHGAEDPLVTPERVQAFEKEMQGAGVDYQLISYGGVVHSFTNPEAKDRPGGSAYHAATDRRSWEAMKAFFGEIFSRPDVGL